MRTTSKRRAETRPREVELALEAPPSVIEPIASGSGALTGRAKTRRLRSLYFDTDHGALWRAGIALRVRQDGKRYLQTLKRRSAPTAGLFERLELEAELAAPEPDLARIADFELVARIDALCGERALFPLLETEFTRVLRRTTFEGSRIEVACDVGEARSSAGSFPISQLELELLDGEPGALFRLAAELRHKHPELRPALHDKTELAFFALHDARPEAVRSKQLALPDDATADALFGALLVEGVRCVTANQAAALDGASTEGVHQMRVGIRRLRMLLKLLEDELPAERADALREALDTVAGALGAVRDLDVFLELLVECETSGEVELAGLRATSSEARSLAHAELCRLFATPEAAQLAVELGVLAFGAEWRTPERAADLARPASDLARDLVERCDRWASKAGRGFASLDEAGRHALRIRVKGARYATELLSNLLPAQRAKRYARRAAELQDLLGAATDAAAARTMLESQHADLASAAFVSGWNAQRTARAREELPRAWRRFRRARRPWK